MILFGTIPTKQLAAIWALLPLAAVLTAATGNAADKSKSIAEIALYRGSDRERILVEGARQEGELTLYASSNWIARSLPPSLEKSIRS